MVHQLPSQLVFLYANKLYLFITYSVIFFLTNYEPRIGLILMLIVLYGHANFLVAIS
jgi:hypothetical protein